MTEPLTASYVRVLDGYYARPGYFTTDLARGMIRTPTGARICVVTEDFLRGFRAAVRFECGKATDRVFKKCGVRWGAAFAARFERELSDHFGVPAKELSAGLVQNCLDEAFRHHGWGRVVLDLTAYDWGVVQVTVHDPVMAAVVGQSDRPADSLTAGFLAGVFGYFAGTELDCQQTECPTRGAAAARFVVGGPVRLKPVPGWVADGTPHAAVVARLRRAADVD